MRPKYIRRGLSAIVSEMWFVSERWEVHRWFVASGVEVIAWVKLTLALHRVSGHCRVTYQPYYTGTCSKVSLPHEDRTYFQYQSEFIFECWQWFCEAFYLNTEACRTIQFRCWSRSHHRRTHTVCREIGLSTLEDFASKLLVKGNFDAKTITG